MRYKMSSLFLRCGVMALAAAGACSAATASAQDAAGLPADTPATESPQDTPQSSEASSEPAAQTGDARVADIVVTANRRTERLQSVPISVTVVDGAQLTRQNVNNIEDLTRSAPSLAQAGTPGAGTLSIRGVGSLSYSRTSEGSVGVVVDGVALANTSVNSPQLFDVARAEVLEGPQGTLFGRNASAGVLNITTIAPRFDKVEVIGHADIGTRGNYVGRGVLNLPVGDDAALRVSGSYVQDPRTITDLASGTDQHREGKSGRARFRWRPNAMIEINLSGDYTDTDINGGAPWAVFAATPGRPLSARLTACGVTIGQTNDKGCIDTINKQSNVTYGFSGQADIDFGFATLTSISAYRASTGRALQDLDATPAYRLNQFPRTNVSNFSQEFRLASPSGGLIEYVAGLYYFDSKIRSSTLLVGPLLTDLNLIGACPLPAAVLCTLPVGQTLDTRAQITSYAAFGQATINATPALRFILGGRVGHEDVSALSVSAVAPGAIGAISGTGTVAANPTDSYFSYRLGAQYDLSKAVMAYATYTRGYKGPAVNDQSASAFGSIVVRPEIPKAGEIGLKSTFAGGRAALNIAGFYTRIDDFQAQIYDVRSASFVFTNASKFTSQGITANLFGSPVRGLTANIGATYLKTRYGKGYFVLDATNAFVDAHDYPTGWNIRATASTEYTTALGGGVDGFVQADVVYSPVQYSDAARSEILSIKGAAIVGGRIGTRFEDGRFGISAYVRNLFDTFRAGARFPQTAGAQQLDPLSYSQFVGPDAYRTIGLSLDARF